MMRNPMEIGSSENEIQNPTWLFDYDLMMDDGISSVVSGHNFSPLPPPASIDFRWTSHAINSCSTVCSEVDHSFEESECLKESGSRKSDNLCYSDSAFSRAVSVFTRHDVAMGMEYVPDMVNSTANLYFDQLFGTYTALL